MSNALAKLSRIHAAIQKANTVDEILEIRDQATAIVTYAKAAGLKRKIVNAAVEAKIRTERKAGEILSTMNLRGGDRKSKGHDAPLMLADIGVTKDQSKRWQRLAAIPDDEFAVFVESRNMDGGEELTTASLMRHWSKISKPANKRPAEKATSLSKMLDKLHSAIVKLYAGWPATKRKSLAAKLRAYADELDETGELAL